MLIIALNRIFFGYLQRLDFQPIMAVPLIMTEIYIAEGEPKDRQLVNKTEHS